ncbi:hypothetical protein NSND_50087 [Nitrospira sp. ND1]|nr:hypothetical protein NSND_50087 [Nitrospira sp. ND1]
MVGGTLRPPGSARQALFIGGVTGMDADQPSEGFVDQWRGGIWRCRVRHPSYHCAHDCP